jgi:CHAT domain-containing protein
MPSRLAAMPKCQPAGTIWQRLPPSRCGKFVDQAYGNLFGSLALTPGAGRSDAADDGYLTLAETYELNLQGTELAILSACETNVGPTQRGEGVWALSRGFLVAGARRVIASNWLVDDEGAARLVKHFCSLVAEDQAAGRTPDYAKALQKAKLWLRSQEDWNSPYYWAPFVLVGPS